MLGIKTDHVLRRYLRYANALPLVVDLRQLWDAQRDFSERAFPGVTPLAVLRHIESEVREAIEDPDDIREWADMLLLVIDGVRRQGFELEDLIRAAFVKLDVNEGREWPVLADKNLPVEHKR